MGDLLAALKPFTSGGGEWGNYKAWIVNGAPTKEAGIQAAKWLTSCQVKADEATVAAKGKK